MVACRATQKHILTMVESLKLSYPPGNQLHGLLENPALIYSMTTPPAKKTRPPLKKRHFPSISHPSMPNHPMVPTRPPFLSPRAVLLGQCSETIKMSPMRKRAKTCSLRGGKIPDSTATSSAVRCFRSRSSMSQPWRTRSSEMSLAPMFRVG